MLERRGLIALRGSGSRILTGIGVRSLGSRASDSERENPVLEERRRRVRELARARFAEQQLKKRGEVEKKYKRGEIDGRKFVDWGKDKFRLPLRDGSGLLLGKAERERIENAKIARKKAEDLEKERENLKKKTKKSQEVTKSKDSRSSNVKAKEKSSSIDTEEEEEEEDDEEFEPGKKLKKKKKKGSVPVAKPKSQGTELIEAAIKSLKSLQREVDGVVEPLDLPPAKVEGWKTSYRDRVERALVDKGLVPQEESGTVATGEEEIPESTAILNSFMESNEFESSEEDDEDFKSFEEIVIKGGDDQTASWESEKMIEEFNTATTSSSAQGDEKVSDEDDQRASLEREKMIEDLNTATTSSSAQGDEKVSGATQAKALLAAIDDRSADIGSVSLDEQMSVRVGIIGAPNAGKSSLLNFMVGTKVSAVSRKTNTTRNEILGVLTENDTQVLFYDTPGLMMRWKGQAVRRDVKSRVQSAWMVTGHCEVLIVLVDAHRQIERPDQRVRKLIEKLGEKKDPKQKRILCLNKVDLIRQKRELVPLAQEFGSLPGYDRVFMISGLRGSGVRHLKEYLLEKAVPRPWEEEKGVVTDMSPIAVAKEVVWEHVLDNVHQEIPYHLHHKHVSWKILKDRSIRIEQQIIVPTDSQKKILIGKNGGLIRKIGMAANEELSARFGAKVHLILDVKIAGSDNMYAASENAADEMWL
ncbi:GTP-binding protein ERG [Selaginella moellendorffii]|uniref:GTP-binding protein ERG n=1 Tax=Selaginella moellendorffii TaxID=88036 RepID=UPI000D1C8142|nr:GTP-binding protein ERG [Selaginella moellendorffii]|eukprot:XP_024527232.1 GTP-binding protein ERG [Selaginella moellendorffii]